MALVRLSRYEFADVQVDSSGRTFLDVVPPVSKSRLVVGADRATVGDGDTLWTLAWREYEALLDREEDVRPTSFFDAVAQANAVVDPTLPFETGTVFLLPSIDVVLTEVRAPQPGTVAGGPAP